MTNTNAEGNFNIEYNFSECDSIKAEYVGYHSLRKNIKDLVINSKQN